MSDISFFKIFMIFGIVSAWAKQALEDGKITLVEAADLGTELGELLGIPVDIKAESFQAFKPREPESEPVAAAAAETVEERASPAAADSGTDWPPE